MSNFWCYLTISVIVAAIIAIIIGSGGTAVAILEGAIALSKALTELGIFGVVGESAVFGFLAGLGALIAMGIGELIRRLCEWLRSLG